MQEEAAVRVPRPESKRRRGRIALALGVLVGWLVAIVIAVPLAGRLSSVQQNDPTLFLPADAEATRVLQLQPQFRSGDVTPALIVYERPTGINPTDRATVAEQVAKMATVTGVAGRPSPAIQSADGKALEVVIGVKGGSLTAGGDTVAALRRIAQGAPGLAAHVAGPAGLGADFGAAFKALDIKLLFGTTIVVVLILLAVYRSPVLWILPLAGVGVAVVAAQALVYLAATRLGMSSNGQSQGILTVLLFGAGTDYALLLVSRYREELRHYARSSDALVVALRRAAPAILASGSTVILSLLCLTLSQDGSNRSLGPTGAIGIASAMVAMLTFLPAILALTGRFVFWPLTPRVQRETTSPAGLWNRIASFVGGRSRSLLVVSVAILALMAVGLTQLHADGVPVRSQYTVSVDSTVGQRIIDQHFPASETSDATIVAAAGSADAVQRAAQSVAGVASVTLLPATPGQADPRIVNGRVLITATMSGADASAAARATVGRLRTAVHAVPGAAALVGGTTATTLDTGVAAQRDFRVIVPLVLVLITIVLLILLRSLVAPLLLIGTVVLSFAASLGLSAILFANVFHFAGADATFPLTAFVFLVALGIDYNIFLMSRVREFAARIGTRAGVLRGLTSTGSVITSAGLVLAATFSVFAVLPLVLLAEVGIAVAGGVLIDTIIVRTLVVPALTHQLGGAIWWPVRLAADAGPHVEVVPEA